ncbi:Cof-type HAD-IIB family hydrolase [Commensalibacter papalotli (ex Servin-Garciduenas et al. 2014)]|uniref:Cof family hydrolase n=1 Tax=Commensalibacter papalotli (ex Servin-Garciduenas et al. 2014) TaxID=1208583 RepID=W7DZB5_9PROT|nr:Cof-type HAD-IIB family hydrolase [Commensalibacter papalotli (ex Servin-Garciduenas et al. 2014)]EUK18049.1 cof family hydrolase [Commensalibacter papalotli (ex Servin-Garciduenas et al. 2014)]
MLGNLDNHRIDKKPSNKIKLLVSDIDGTLITDDKRITPEALTAVQKLKEAGIHLCLVSSRPPQGIQMFFKDLNIVTPFAALNGGEIIGNDGSVASSMAMKTQDADEVCELLQKNDVKAWIFGGFDWVVFDRNDPFISHEKAVVGGDPEIIDHISQYKNRIVKIEGVSSNTALLDKLADQINQKYPDTVKALRSSDHYLDITHPKANKGFAAIELGKQYGIDISEIACIGDMDNDIPMLEIAGLAIAMGQSSERVYRHAHFQTKSNEDNGWAYAVENFILPRA